MPTEKTATLSLEERQLANEERQLAIQERQIALQEEALKVSRAHEKLARKKSLDYPPMISPFNPRGEKDFPMPDLKCEIHAPWSMKPGLHGNDREEVELFNLLEPGEYQVELLDQTTVTLCVLAEKNAVTGKLEHMALMGAYDPGEKQHAAFFTQDRKQIVPPMRHLLRQMLGEKAAHVLPMKEELRRIALPPDHPQHLPVSVGE
jgi:hypothetical protein